MKEQNVNAKADVCKSTVQYAAALVFMLCAAGIPANAGDAPALSDAEIVRMELNKLISLQESLIESYSEFYPTDLSMARSIKEQRKLVASMSAEDLLVLAGADVSLIEMNVELAYSVKEFTEAVKKTTPQTFVGKIKSDFQQPWASSGFDLAPVTAGAIQLGDDCPSDSLVELGRVIFDPAKLPPGYCNQTDEIPAGRDPITGAVIDKLEYRLSDVQYAGCPFNTPLSVITTLDQVATSLKFINSTLGKICQQEAAGFNGSAACSPVIAAFKFAAQLAELPSYCNAIRRNAEGSSLYARTGEIFVQGREQFRSLGETNAFIQTATTELRLSVGNDVTKTGNDISEELDTGFDGIRVQMSVLEATQLENESKIDFARSNNGAIEYKIWCDKQRPQLRPSNCE